MMIDVVMHGQGRLICICFGVVVLAMEVLRFWVTITWSFMVQTLKILADAYTGRIIRSQSTLKDVIERYF